MSGSVIVAGARTPIGRLLGGLKDKSAADLGGVAIKAALERAGVTGDQVDYVIMGQVIQAGAGQNTARHGRHRGGAADVAPVDHHQQGLPVRPERDRDGRPAHPRRRARDRRRRRHGVDDQRPAPAAEVARGLQVRRRRARRLDGLRRPARPVHRPGDGRADRACNAEAAGLSPRGAGRLRRPLAPARRRGVEERPLRRRGRPGRDPAAQGRPGRRLPGRGHPRRHHRGVAGEAPARVRQGRHDHRRLGLADLRRRLRGRRDEQGEGRGARAAPGSPRSARTARSPARTRPCRRSRPTRS